MGKVIVRYLVVLLAACLVALALYLVVQNNSSNLGIGEAPGGFEQHLGKPQESGEVPPADFTISGNRVQEHGFEGEAGILPGWAGLLRNMGIIALMTVCVFILQKGFGLIFRRRKRLV